MKVPFYGVFTVVAEILVTDARGQNASSRKKKCNLCDLPIDKCEKRCIIVCKKTGARGGGERRRS